MAKVTPSRKEQCPQDLRDQLGRRAWWTPPDCEAGYPGIVEPMVFLVVVRDARRMFGRVDYLVTPYLEGQGEKWVGEQNLEFHRAS